MFSPVITSQSLQLSSLPQSYSSGLSIIPQHSGNGEINCNIGMSIFTALYEDRVYAFQYLRSPLPLLLRINDISLDALAVKM
jgi:hypothetical protein